jgi:hypothetical protein
MATSEFRRQEKDDVQYGDTECHQDESGAHKEDDRAE